MLFLLFIIWKVIKLHFVSLFISFLFLLFPVAAESDKKVNDGEEIDMVDSSGAGVDYLMHRPEEETVTQLKNDERLMLSKSNSKHTNEQQTNGDSSGSVTLDKRNKDEKLREKSATNDDKFTGLKHSGSSNQSTTPQTMTHHADADITAATAAVAKDPLIDDLDDDPYAELQSYLDKVKVSSTCFYLFRLFCSSFFFGTSFN